MASVVLKVLTSRDVEDCSASARTMFTEGLPFAVPALDAEEGTSSADAVVDSFRKEFVGYVEKMFSEAKQKDVDDAAAEEAKIQKAFAERDSLAETAEAVARELETVTARLETQRASFKELEAKVAEAEAKHDEISANTAHQRELFEELRQDYASAKALEEVALPMLGADEGYETSREMAVSSVTSLLERSRADGVLKAAAPHALLLKPSDRGSYDRMAVEAVSAFVKKRVAELGEQMAGLETEYKLCRADVAGLWAIADCERDLARKAKEQLDKTEMEHVAGMAASRKTLERASEIEAEVDEHRATKASAATREQEVEGALAALKRLAMPPPEVSETKRQKVVEIE